MLDRDYLVEQAKAYAQEYKKMEGLIGFGATFDSRHICVPTIQLDKKGFIKMFPDKIAEGKVKVEGLSGYQEHSIKYNGVKFFAIY